MKKLKQVWRMGFSPIPRALYPILLLLLCAAALPAFADGTINIANPGDGNGWRSNGGTVVTIFANGNYTVTGASSIYSIVVSENVTATITLQDAKIHSALSCPFMLSSNDTGGSQVTLILSGTNELVTTHVVSAGLTVEDNARILIKGDGSLLAKGGYDAIAGTGGGAAIGSRARHNAGNITIAGGTITATGGIVAAGIGGGIGGDGGNITITGGTITASGGTNGAGIGGGVLGDGGNITITGGAITATGGREAAGIGDGARASDNGGKITITGGMITASGGEFSAAIGGGSLSDGGTINISGGTIVAYAWDGGTGDPATIGGGAWGPAGTINISGGTVYASKGTGPSIGGGNGTGGGLINITGGTVIAGAIGIGKVSRTPTVISGAKTLVLSPSINTGTFGEATVRQHVVVNINSGPNTDVILNENVPISEGMMFVVPDGLILNVNNYALHNGGIIRKFGALNNTGNMTGNAPVGPIQADWVAPVASHVWTGNAITPAVTVKDGVNVLAEGVYYSAAYENNSNAGTGVVVITDLGDYHTVTTRTFTITGKPLPDNAIEAISAQTYTGSAILPAVVVKDGSKTLVRDTDYIVSGANNINVGTGATVTVTGRGNYSGSISRTFTISPKALERSFIQSIAAQTYTGSAIIPAVVVKDSSRTLTPNTDYTVSVVNNINVGTGAVVTVSGRGNYTGSATANFSIIARQLAADNIETIAAQLYTGNFVKPAVVVRDGSRILTEGTDYAVAYTDNVYVGTATVTVTGRGNYTGSAVKTFLIYTVPITGVWIEDIPAQTYTGDSIKPVLTVRDGNTILTAGVHYSVAYKNNVNAGTATATVTGVGGYTETMNKSFTIHPKPITAGWIDSIPAQTYTGYSLTPAVTVRDGNTILTAGVHYSATCINNVYAGTATVTVTGVGNYSGTASKSFTINPKPITGDWIESIPAQTYTGDSLKPALTVRDGNAILTAGVHYSATYNNNVKVGTATVTITGVGNYTGTASKSFLIEDHTPASVQIVAGWIAEIPAQTYTGDSLKPALTVIDGNSFLFAGVHYSAAYTNNVNVGTAIVIVTGTGNYSGSVYKYFAITPKAVVGDWIETIPNQAYTGSYIQPALTVRDGNNILTAGVHYSATYTNNLDAGTATVTIIGLGNYTGSASKNFVIGNGTSAPVSIAAGWIDDIPAQTYAGSAIQPAVTVRNGNTILIAGADYTTAYSANTNAGTATVIVTGVGNYTGTVYKYFTITPKAVAAGWLGNIPDQTWTGGAINPAVTVMDGSRTLTLGMDYIVNYSNNVNAGTATVTIVGTGNYTGTATGTFNIVRSRIPIQESWVQVIPDQYYTGYSIRPAVTVAGLTQGVDYTVSYYNNTAAGTAIAIVTGIGNYTGEVAQSFRIVDTGTEEATNTVLRIISTDNGISISGLTPGETFGIYTLQGQLLYESKATSPEETIYLGEKGVYILRHKGKAYKFSW